jgi:ABC-type transport system involved in multi-copper enzyme maturation permease subunit
MKGLTATRTMLSVIKWEFRRRLTGRRAWLFLLLLSVLPAAAAWNAFTASQFVDDLDLSPSVHYVFADANKSEPLIVVFISDVWGNPKGSYPVELFENVSTTPSLVGKFATNSEGFFTYRTRMLIDYGIRITYRVHVFDYVLTAAEISSGAISVRFRLADLDFDRIAESRSFHLVHTVGGLPASDVEIWSENSSIGSPDAHGFFRLAVSRPTTISFRIGSTEVFSFEAAPVQGCCAAFPARQGPAYTLAWLWVFVVPILIPLAAIAFSTDTMASERMLGTFEMLLVRPVSREALGLGKLLGVALSFLVLVLVLAGPTLVFISLGFGSLVPADSAAGYLLAIALVSFFYAAFSAVASAYVKTQTNAIILMISLWLLLRFIDLSILNPLLRYASVHELTTNIFGWFLPRIVKDARDVFVGPLIEPYVVLSTLLVAFGLLFLFLRRWEVPSGLSLQWFGRKSVEVKKEQKGDFTTSR